MRQDTPLKDAAGPCRSRQQQSALLRWFQGPHHRSTAHQLPCSRHGIHNIFTIGLRTYDILLFSQWLQDAAEAGSAGQQRSPQHMAAAGRQHSREEPPPMSISMQQRLTHRPGGSASPQPHSQHLSNGAQVTQSPKQSALENNLLLIQQEGLQHFRLHTQPKDLD